MGCIMDTQETKVYIAALIAAGVLGILLLYFIITMIKQQRKTLRLHLEKIQAEILAQEKERKKIAADLHDELGPLLSAVKFKINSVDLLRKEDEELIEKASQHIDETLEQIRRISFDLLPNTLIRKGLVETIDEFIPKVEKLVPLEIKFVHREVNNLPDDIKVNLYRILLEIINNTVKHSGAKTLKITLTRLPRKIKLQTADDGVGFDLEKNVSVNSGLGLRNLQSRAEIMHGEFLINTAPGLGVRYNIEIPLP
jgi:two-component system, NarL family, sensor kinase